MGSYFIRLLLLLLFLAAPLHSQRELELTILHYNDFHARNTTGELTVLDEGGERIRVPVGGSAVLKAYVDRYRDSLQNVLLLHAGDDFQGSPVCSITRGASQFELLELLQPDAMVVGNHEFDYGADRLRALLPTVTFPVISANLWDKARGTPFVPRYRLLRIQGVTIGIIGLSPPDLPSLTMRDNVKDIEVLDPIMTTRHTMNELRNTHGAKMCIILSHMGVEADSVLAEHVPGITVIVGGHSHTALFEAKHVNAVPIVQAGAHGKWLGKLDLRIDAGTGLLLSAAGELIPTRADSITPDPVVAEKVRELEMLVDEGMREVIGTLEVDWVHDRHTESNMGNWQADVMREFAAVDIAFQNSGAIRKNLPAGPITLRDMWEISPFGNDFVTFDVSGVQLLGVLRYQATESREFCQVSGLRYSYDHNAPADQALVVSVGGEQLELTRQYSIVTNRYVASHLHDVFGLPEADISVTPVLPVHVDRDVFIDAIRRQHSVRSRIDGRISILGERR